MNVFENLGEEKAKKLIDILIAKGYTKDDAFTEVYSIECNTDIKDDNQRNKKYAAIITQETERYTKGDVDLSYFGDHPLEGDFIEIVFGDTYEELMDDGRNEGLFYFLIALETDEIIGKGIFDPFGPADEIKAYEQRMLQSKPSKAKVVIGAKEFRSRVITKLYCTFMKKIGRIENISDKGITLDMSSKYHSETELLRMQEIQSIDRFEENNK